MKLSVIIPTLNEAANLDGLLRRLSETPGVDEVVVADGGSTDGTRDLVRAPARLTRTEPGRGIQLRAGVAEATGDVFLFLHADVVPPADVADQIEGAMNSGFVGGNFRLRYPDGGLLGRWLEVLAPINRRRKRYYGDSGIFVRRDVYEACGGMPHVPIMEDVMFIERMERRGETAYLPGPMISSARRWKESPIRTLLLWASLQIAFTFGVSPWRLARLYRKD